MTNIDMQIRLQEVQTVLSLMLFERKAVLMANKQNGDFEGAMYCSGAIESLEGVQALFNDLLNTDTDLIDSYMKRLKQGMKAGGHK